MMGGSGRREAGGGPVVRRWVWQAAVSAALLVMIAALFHLPGEQAALAQRVIRRYVVADYGLTPVFRFMDTIMTWGDLAAAPESFELPPAALVSLPADGRILASASSPEDQPAAQSGQRKAQRVAAPLAAGEAAAGDEPAGAGALADAGALAGYQGAWIETEAGSGVRAAMAGRISETGQTDSGLAWFVLDSGLGWSFRYSHCRELRIAEGDQVSQGQLLGKAGDSLTAAAKGDGAPREAGRVYVQVYYQGQALEPAAFFLGEPQ
jgi:murein DD-endopeptidase MepM/ murein hydrolase activator NlpD